METCIASSSSKLQHRIFRMARLLIVIIALVVLAASISAQDEDREKRYMYPGGGIGGGMMCIRANMPCTPGGMNGRRCCVGMCTYSGMGYRCSMMG